MLRRMGLRRDVNDGSIKPDELAALLEREAQMRCALSRLAPSASLAAFLAWLESPEYRAHLEACAQWAASDPRLIVGHVGSYG